MARFGEPQQDGRLGGFARKTGGFQGFPGFGRSENDLSTPEGLLELARLQGGAVAEVAEELMHPEKSLLSRMGESAKTTFRSFVDVISIPSQVIAGIMSPDHSIKEAIDQDIMPSDVLFGDQDPDDDSAMSKVGNFITRFATDVLLTNSSNGLPSKPRIAPVFLAVASSPLICILTALS